MDSSRRQYSTGLPFFDRKLDGGVYAGTLLALTAPANSQSELLLRELLTTRPTLYVSTHRPVAEVETWANAGAATPPELSVTRDEPGTLLGDPGALASRVPPESFVVVDRTNALESASRGEYLAVLDELKAALVEQDSVGVVHCPEHAQSPPLRDLTLSRVDQVWQLEQLALSRDIKTRLLVMKARYGRAVDEPIDILLTDRVAIDTSQNIA